MAESMDLIAFYHEHRSQVLRYGSVFLVLVTLLISYAVNGSPAESTAKAQEALQKWQKTPMNAALEKSLRTSLRKAPHVERILNADVAQILLAAGRTAESEALASEYVARLSKEAPLHAAFAKTSFLIEKKEYQKALEQAVNLKERLEVGSTLSLYNLFRIACLQKQLGNNPGELAAWEELRGLLEADQSAAFLLKANFQRQTGQKSFGLNEFISLRERFLAAP